MIRRLYVIACTVSLLMCIGTGALWVRSYRPFTLRFPAGQLEPARITVDHGVLTFVGNHGFFFGCSAGYELWRPLLATALLWASPFLYRYLRSAGGVLAIVLLANAAACGLGGNLLAILLVLVLDALFFLLVIRDLTMRPKKIPPGICVGCGYDLRATPDRCPECGRLVDRCDTIVHQE